MLPPSRRLGRDCSPAIAHVREVCGRGLGLGKARSAVVCLPFPQVPGGPLLPGVRLPEQRRPADEGAPAGRQGVGDRPVPQEVPSGASCVGSRTTYSSFRSKP